MTTDNLEQWQLQNLMDPEDNDMSMMVFRGACDEGIVAVLTFYPEHGAEIANVFNFGAWSDGADALDALRKGLDRLPWFPIVYTDTAVNATQTMQAKLDSISKNVEDTHVWRNCVHEVCELIAEQDYDDISRLSPILSVASTQLPEESM